MATTMNVEKKLTKVQKFEMLLTIPAVAENEMLVEFIKHEQELLSKKNSSEKKPTKTQMANEAIKSAIFEGMETNRMYTVTEIQKEIQECGELTNQKISSLLRQMVESGKVARVEEKRKAFFQKVEG